RLLRSSLSVLATTAPSLPPLSLHDALPISFKRAAPEPLQRRPSRSTLPARGQRHSNTRGANRGGSRLTPNRPGQSAARKPPNLRSEEHTSELQSRFDLVCRLLLEKKKCTCR